MTDLDLAITTSMESDAKMEQGIDLLEAQIARCIENEHAWQARALRGVHRAACGILLSHSHGAPPTKTVPVACIDTNSDPSDPQEHRAEQLIYLIGGNIALTDAAEPCVWRDDIPGGWCVITAEHIAAMRAYEMYWWLKQR
jgi:hypothetical protein